MAQNRVRCYLSRLCPTRSNERRIGPSLRRWRSTSGPKSVVFAVTRVRTANHSKGDLGSKVRVSTAIALLVGAKVINQVEFVSIASCLYLI